MQQLVKLRYLGMFRKFLALSLVSEEERSGRLETARLKVLRGRRGATSITSFSNNPDAALTGLRGVPEQNLRVSVRKTPQVTERRLAHSSTSTRHVLGEPKP